MSVVGIDIGNAKSKVAIARNRGIDVAVNDVSNRETPSLVSFNNDERFTGESATTQETSNAKNTVNRLMQIIGKKFASPDVQKIIPHLPYKLTEDADGGVLINVQYGGEQQTFKPARVMAMLMSNLRATAEGELKTKVTDCVFAVPVGFKMGERKAIIDAAKIIGLNPLTLINSTTAAALQWGFYKKPEDGQTVCIADCGHSSLDVAVVRFTPSSLTVLGTASSTAMSSSTMDAVIANYLKEQFQEKYKIDCMSRPRPKVRVFAAAEKAKRVLSANPETPVNIECLMDDIDVSTKITREIFEELMAEQLADVGPTITAALEMAGVGADAIANVELLGGSSWIPMVASTISGVFGGKQVSRTLNASDAIAKGACLQCAMLSRTLKVRDYVITDICPYGISASWTKSNSDEVKTVTVFAQKNKLPDRKTLTFMRDEAFDIQIAYEGDNGPLASCRVSAMKVKADREKEAEEWGRKKAKLMGEEWSGDVGEVKRNTIKVTLELTSSGVLNVEGAHMHEEYEVEVEEKKPSKVEPPKEEPPKEEPKKEDPAAAAAAAADPAPAAEAPENPFAKDGDAEMADGETPPAMPDRSESTVAFEDAAPNADAAPAAPMDTTDIPGDTPRGPPAAAAALAAEPEPAPPKYSFKKKTRKVPITCETRQSIGLSSPELQTESDSEWKLIAKDREIKAKHEARNALESYVYDMRDALSEGYGKYSPYMEAAARTDFVGKLSATEDWLYTDEGEDATRVVMEEKLGELKLVGDGAVERCRETEGRAQAKADVEAALAMATMLVASADEKHAHILPADREPCGAKIAEIQALLTARLAEIDAQPKHVKATYTNASLRELGKQVTDFVNPIMNKPKPKPPKEEMKEEKKDGEKEDGKEEDGEKEDGKEGEKGAEEPTAAAATAEGEPKPAAAAADGMDLD